MADMPYSSESEEELEELEEHQEYREVSMPAPVPTTVIEAIDSAAHDRIRALLLEIVTTVPAAKHLTEQRLLLPLAPAALSAPASSILKRKAYETCKNCQSEFSVNDNYKGACVYHDGEKEADDDSDVWADHDERCHGRIDDLVDDPDYEEGFLWSCCGESGSAEGCVVSRHDPKDSSGVKKPRQILLPISRNAQAGVRR